MEKGLQNAQPHLWYKDLKDERKGPEPTPDDLLISLKDEAKRCLDGDTASYNIKNSKTNSNFQWMKTVMAKGVVSDKIAANVIMIQDSPVHNLDTLASLVNTVKVGKKKECMIIVDSLVDLFLENLLPPNRKLVPFRERPLTKLPDLSSGNAIKRKKYLMHWYFEDQLKETFATFVRALNTIAHDTVDANKEKALVAMFKLLCSNAEQEKNLLANIVNKLGDPSRKVASKSIYCLTQLLKKHSNMQGVVLGEIEKMLFRPNISQRSQYYGLCFLSQFYLSHEDSEVARRLIEVYFSFFKACIKKGEVNSRMMSALLMGVNRAYPYAKVEMEKIADHVNTMYRVVHIANFNVSLHALTLLYQVSDGSDVSDRFYSALYKKLQDPQITTTTHQAMLLSLVFKALSKDTKIDRIKVIIKRLLQNAAYAQPALACGALYVVSQLISKRPELSALVLKASSFAGEHDSEDEERYEDVKEEDAETVVKVEEEDSVVTVKIEDDEKAAVGSSWLHSTNVKTKLLEKTSYDGLCRNPLYGGGKFCSYTELEHLRHHYHPTVSLFAQNLLNGQTISYTGDPLKDFTLIKFLDRFVFKNPKKLEELNKPGNDALFGKRKHYVPAGARSLAVNSTSYLNMNEKSIPVEEQFLYTFLHKRRQERQKDDESDADSVASEEFQEMLDKMTGGHKDDDEDLDYLDDVGDALKTKPKRGKAPAEDEQEDEEEEDEEEQLNSDDDDKFGEEDDDLDLDDDDAASDIVFDSEDEPETKPKKKVRKEDIQALFASADEFASLLEDEGGSGYAPGGASSWSNKDNAHVKQLSWEDKRNTWIKGYSKQAKGGKNKQLGKRKQDSNKGNSHNKKKKFKK